MIRRLVISVSLSLSVYLVVAIARADDTISYTVKPGDTCAAIAQRFYGDSRLVDLIHEANPGMGPTPHSLAPGRVLRLPPRPPSPPSGPDARLTKSRNVVEVHAPEPRPAKPNDPLFRGNRVGTKERSSADVTFRDETQVKLGENTVVVILGDEKSRAARVGAAETTLVTGSLRARLSELAGKGGASPRVATDAGEVAMKQGEAQVSVDDKKTTRVAVYDGSSTLTAQRKSVDVTGGFGSKAAIGQPPTPPRPLPEAPRWSATPGGLVLATAPTDLSFGFEPVAASSAPPAEWHVQLARDSAFDDLVVDARVPASTRSIETKNAGAGSYFARVSAIDDDAFEGRWSTVASVDVAVVVASPLPGRRSRVTVTPPEVGCAVAGVAASSDFELDRAKPNVLSCSTHDGRRSSIELARVPLGRVDALASIARRGGQSFVEVRLTDADGAPVDRVTVALESAPPGVRLGAFEAVGPGTFAAPLGAAPGASGGPLRLRVADEAIVTTNPLPSVPPADQAVARDETRIEVTGAARVTRILEQVGVGGAIGVRATVPVRLGEVTVGGEAVFEAVPPGTSHIDGLGDTRVRADVLGAHGTVGLRVGPRSARLAPWIAVGPSVLGARARIGPESSDVGSRSIAGGVYGGGGLELRLGGADAVFLELSGRYMFEIDRKASAPAIDTTGASIAAGYRLRL